MRIGKTLLVMVAALTMAACERVPIGRDGQDAAVDRPSPGDGRPDPQSPDTQIDSQQVDAQIDTRASTPAMPDAAPDVADAAPATSDATSGDGAGINQCVRDQDCETYVDFCAATCGVCIVQSVPSGGRSACRPPANVECLNACQGRTAVCMSGQCALR